MYSPSWPASIVIDIKIMDKIFFLVERIFDQNNLNGRLIFLETDSDSMVKKMPVIINYNKIINNKLDCCE